MLPWYASREQVKAAPDIKQTARNNAQVDRAVEAASRTVEGELRRRFYPQVATYTFARPRRRTLFLDQTQADLVSVTTLTVDGTAVATADRDLLPVTGPPFHRVEFADTISFGSDRRPVSVAGTWGYDNQTAPAGTLAAAVADTSTTTVDVSNSAAVGIGDLLTVDTERMIVTGRAQLDTAQDLQANLTASVADTTVTVTTGTGYAVGEVLLLDAERMLVVDIAGNQLTVRRAFDGSVLAAHTGAVSIFASRRLTVERGVLGTTAASHVNTTAVSRQVYPGPVVALTVALAVNTIMQEPGGYGREIGPAGGEMSLPGRGLADARADAQRAHGRLLLG